MVRDVCDGGAGDFFHVFHHFRHRFQTELRGLLTQNSRFVHHIGFVGRFLGGLHDFFNQLEGLVGFQCLVLSAFGHLLHGQRHVDGYPAHLLPFAGHFFRRSSHYLRRVVDFAQQLVQVFNGQVQGVGHGENVAGSGHFHALGQVAFRDGSHHAAHFQYRRGNGFEQGVERVYQFFPRARYPAYRGAFGQLAFYTGHFGHAANFRRLGGSGRPPCC